MWIESQPQSHGIVIGLDQIKKKIKRHPTHPRGKKAPLTHTITQSPKPTKAAATNQEKDKITKIKINSKT